MEHEDDGRDDLTDPAFLRNLADRLMHVPITFGTDQGDIDRLSEIANTLEGKDQ